jgi:hypothetical protein
MLSLSGSALAQKATPTTNAVNLNSSRSNIYRPVKPKPGGSAPAGVNLNSSSNKARMGGGGGGVSR